MHGGQSEIVLRVKQGDNPTFGFLMPDHHLHAYFRFLVDHPELLSEENKTDSELDQTSGAGRGGALSMLGSVYGSGEDEDGADEDAPELKKSGSEDAVDAANAIVSNGSERTNSPVIVARKDETVSKHSLPPSKEKLPLIKRNQSISTVKTRTSGGTKKDGDALGSVCLAAVKSQAFALPSMSKVEPPIVEPPSDIKRVVDKIVEFILRNGKEFEAVLVEQDRKHGRFSFLLPSNLYYPYYLKVLREAEESKLSGKGFSAEKHDSTGLGVDRKRATFKESDTLSLGSDIPSDSDRKEKFKMVIGKSKKDGQDPPTKATQTNTGITVNAAAAAAILQVATRGIRNPNLEFLKKMYFNGSSQGPSVEGGQDQKLDPKGEPAASGADSLETDLSREEKLKAERLKRAKDFAAMIKHKATPLKTEQLRGISVEPPDSGLSSSAADVVNLAGNEREGSSVPPDIDTSDVKEKSEKKDLGDDQERRSKRSYRSRSKRNEEEEEEEAEEVKKDHKHSKRKRKSHRSSHESSRDRKRHSSSKDSDSLRRHKHDKNDDSSDHEDRHSSKHRYKHDNTSDDNEYQQLRDRHSSSDDEHRHSRHHHKHDSSSRRRHRHNSFDEDEEEHRHHHHRRRSSKHRKRSHREKEVDLEEGEIKSDQSKASESYAAVSREASVDLSKSYQDARTASSSSQPSNTNEVSDDLRAKIRAMLMATL
ncbi:hypothetical protein Dsin_023169 [Dipteronia sinensis]|uniref:SURP motif domain-containing protein n=1 Tax=Dipteronia sinensis TaxID=43782 RepID=A0AAE0A3Y7_9ROSI|nr:hypothetical protein Dsin_023169 [Dipteronia sinensis]